MQEAEAAAEVQFFKNAAQVIADAGSRFASFVSNQFSRIGSTGQIGEDALKQLGGQSQQYFTTNLGGRFVDQLVQRDAHEAKVGYQYLSQTIQTQIAKDAELLGTGKVDSYTWHFYVSPVTGQIGPSDPLNRALQNVGISVQIHFQ